MVAARHRTVREVEEDAGVGTAHHGGLRLAPLWTPLAVRHLAPRRVDGAGRQAQTGIVWFRAALGAWPSESRVEGRARLTALRVTLCARGVRTFPTWREVLTVAWSDVPGVCWPEPVGAVIAIDVQVPLVRVSAELSILRNERTAPGLYLVGRYMNLPRSLAESGQLHRSDLSLGIDA